LLFGAALLAAWAAGKKPDVRPGEVQVLSASASEVGRIEWAAGAEHVSIQPARDARGAYYRVEKTYPPGSEPSEKAVFLGGEAMRKAVDKLARLTALRSLGGLEGDRLKPFGLDTPRGKLTLWLGNEPREFWVGKGVLGAGAEYVKDARDGQAYAVEASVLSQLIAPEAELFERALYDFDLDEVDRIEVARAGVTRRFVRVEGKKGAWATPEQPGLRNDDASAWLERMTSLVALEYFETAPAIRSEVARVRFDSRARERGTLVLAVGPERPDLRDGGKLRTPYYARTEHTRWFVRVPEEFGVELAQRAPDVIR
jgi:hypothetical protein